MQAKTQWHVTGWGAVSPAGWGGGELATVLADQAATGAGGSLPVTRSRRHPDAPETATRAVPAAPEGVSAPRHPRLRRTSPVARHAMAAALQAIGSGRAEQVRNGRLRLGIVFCVMNGCVQFSGRFYAEVLENPATASPLLFPETVFNSPSSHLSSALGAGGLNHTLIGDAAGFYSGLALAIEWLEDDQVDASLVVAAEELDWLSAEAVHLFDHAGIAAEGAGALLLQAGAAASDPGIPAVELASIAGPLVYGRRCPQGKAARAIAAGLRDRLPPDDTGHDPGSPSAGGVGAEARPTLLIDSRRGHARLDRAEAAAWRDWRGPVWSPQLHLGEGFAAHGAWQCVAACEAIAGGQFDRVITSGIGGTMQAAGALFCRA